MDLRPELTAGCLEKIMKERNQQKPSSDEDNDEDKPLVQILASKLITKGSVRCVLFDGINTSKQAVLKHSHELDHYYQRHYLEKFSVIRLDEYCVQSQTQTQCPNNIEVIIVSNITPIMKGSEINKKLEVFPPLNEEMDCDVVPSFASDPNEVSFMASFNPNYKPRDRRPKTKDLGPIDRSKLCPISDIQPFHNSFVIRVRIANKSPIKTFNGKNGREGKLFSFDATDETSEIRITAFNTECDKYFDLIERDLIYFISKGCVKNANKRFSNLKSDYEITLTSYSQIEVCDEPIPLPSIKFNFMPINELLAQNKGNSVDVIGIITFVDEFQPFIAKSDQKEYQKRDVFLVDKTLHEVILTLWGEEANKFSATAGQVLAVKSALVGEFRGKTLGCVQNSIIELDPDLTEAHLLKGWYDRESTAGGLKNIKPLSKRRDDKQTSSVKFLCQVNAGSVPEDTVLYYNCMATIIAQPMADRQLYKSCINRSCLKKVVEDNGFYFCEKCGQNSTEFEWRLLLSLCCGDSTADHWVTVYQEVAEKMIGKTAAQLSEIFESDPNEFHTLISDLNFRRFMFRIGSRVEEFNNKKQIKSTVYGFTPIDAIERSKQLIKNIKTLT